MSDFTNRSKQSVDRSNTPKGFKERGVRSIKIKQSSAGNKYDIVGKYDWAFVTKEMRERCPYITVRQNKLLTSGLANSLIKGIVESTDTAFGGIGEGIKTYLSKVAGDLDVDDKIANSTAEFKAYKGMYPTESDDGIEYKMPYITEYHTDYSASFEDVAGNGDGSDIGGVGIAKSLAGAGGKAAKTAAAGLSTIDAYTSGKLAWSQSIGEDKIKGFAYEGSEDSGLNIQFNLFNTITEDAAQKNLDLINRIVRAAKPEKVTPYIIEPPRIFDIEIPGVRRIPFSYIENIKVDKIGVTTFKDGKNIPEAYSVAIVFKSLVPDSLNFDLTQSK